MYVLVAGLHSRAVFVSLVCALLCSACSGAGQRSVSVGEGTDAAMPGGDAGVVENVVNCDPVSREGDFVLEQEKDVTVRYRVGAPYSRTIMLFGGELVEEDNTLGNAYVFGLDKTDALMLAAKYPDFYLCSSPGGKEASNYIVPYDLVPASCAIYEQIIRALDTYDKSVTSGGDRTSLRLDGFQLELVSVTVDTTGEDITSQVSDQDFHLVTKVEQLTGESVLEFGTSQ